MKGKLLERQDQQNNGNDVDDNLSSRGVLPCPSAAVFTKADGRGGPNPPNEVVDATQGMAVSVIRHASNPPIEVVPSKLCRIGFPDFCFNGYTGRGYSTPTNPLPKKDEQNQYVLRLVEVLHRYGEGLEQVGSHQINFHPNSLPEKAATWRNVRRKFQNEVRSAVLPHPCRCLPPLSQLVKYLTISTLNINWFYETPTCRSVVNRIYYV